MSNFFTAVFTQDYVVPAIFFLLGVVELLIIYAVYRIRKKRLQSGEETTGRVIDIISKRAAKGGDVYYPVFQFKTYLNKTITHQSTLSSRPSPYKVGDEVIVSYNPDKPERFLIRNDKRYRLLFFVFFGLALCFVVLGLIGLWPLLHRYV